METCCFHEVELSAVHSTTARRGACAYAGYLVRFVPGPELYTGFAFYFTKSEPFQQWLSLSAIHSTIGNINGQKYANLTMPAPAFSEQRVITSFLDREIAKLDSLIAKKERLIELLQEKRTALITQAVTKGLDPDVPMKDSGVEWLGEVPAHWDIKPLSHILARITYGFTNPMPVAADGPFMLTANDIGDGQILWEQARHTTQKAFAEALTNKSRPLDQDILITKDGTLGRVAVADGRLACINQSVALLRIVPEAASVDFIQNVLRATAYQERMTFEAGGTTIKHIYIGRLAKMEIALPPREEQELVCRFISAHRSNIELLTSTVREAINRLRELRTALISAAVTGKIDVRGEAS